MTGRKLYDKFCDAAAAQPLHWGASALPHSEDKAKAWPFLSVRDRRVWNDLARRITPKPRKPAA